MKKKKIANLPKKHTQSNKTPTKNKTNKKHQQTKQITNKSSIIQKTHNRKNFYIGN